MMKKNLKSDPTLPDFTPDFIGQNLPKSRRHVLKSLLAVASLASLPSLLACQDNKTSTHQKLPVGAKVVALGDSLTYGYGADKAAAYPNVLAKLSGWQVQNFGVNGDTSADILKRLPKALEGSPSLVLFGIGGNDVLRKVDPKITQENIENALDRIRRAGSAVVLIAEPYFSLGALFGKLSDNPIYADIAQAKSVPLFADGWSRILSDETLKSDQIHANAQGYRKFAENLYAFLQKEGFA